ncbi:hypothetical protein [Phyllobacterium sp. K27]
MMNRYKSIAVAATLLVLSGGVSYAASPAGKFCGEVISYGDYQDIQTNLNVDRDGRITGTYKIDGLAGRTDGNVIEKDRTSLTERTLIWTDKDGTGLVSLHFSSDYQGFKAAWGGSTNGRFDPPIHSWSGTRCPPTPTP